MDPKFIHLNLHTEFSLQESIVRIKPLMARLAEYCEAGAVGASEGLTAAASDIAEPDNAAAMYAARAMPAVAMTDLYNMFAMVKFYRQALANGIKPLIGVDARVQHSALSLIHI